MANLSGYAPMYVRTTGSDLTGDGSAMSPYATPQRAFEAAYWAGGVKPRKGISTVTIGVDQNITGYFNATFYDADNTPYPMEAYLETTSGSEFSQYVKSTINSSCGEAVRVIGYEYDVQSDTALLTIQNKDYDAPGGRLAPTVQITNTGAVINYVLGTVAGTASSDNYVIDLGVGTFGGVNLEAAVADEWPSRIAVRGAGATQSLLGGVDAHFDEVFDYDTNTTIIPAADGRNVHIVSDRTVNLGNIDSTGGNINANGNFEQGFPYGVAGRAGGDVTLVDVVAGDVLFSALLYSWFYDYFQEGKDGGTGVISGSSVGNVVASGGPGGWVSGTGGSVTLTNSTAGNITSDAGIKESSLIQTGSADGTDGGVITLMDSSAGNISANGGGTSNGGNAESQGDGGNGGTVVLVRSASGIITAKGGGSYNARGGDGGTISLAYSECGTINVLPNTISFLGNNSGEAGTVTFTGKCVLPDLIQAGEVLMGDLRRGKGLNGSDVLGIA